MIKHLILLFAIQLFALLGYAQAPGADCSTATALTVDANCISTFTVSGASTGIALAGTCTVGTVFSEGWYSFTTSTSTVSINVTVNNTGTTSNPALYVYTGACGSLTQAFCANATNTNSTHTESLNFTAAASTTYYVRLANLGTANMPVNNFCINFNYSVIGTPGTTCLTAVPITYNGPAFSAYVSDVSMNQPSAACGPGVREKWFYITSPACVPATVTISATSATSTNLQLILTTTVVCASMASSQTVTCAAFGSAGINNTVNLTYTLTAPSTNYYIKVQTLTGANFSAKDITVRGAPSNDECTCATTLTPSTTCTNTSGSVANATISSGITSGCSSPPANTYDVWYKFTATGTTHNVNLSSLSSSFNGGIEVFSGACGGLTSIACIAGAGNGVNNFLPVDNLTITNTYYVRIFNWNGTTLTHGNGNFNICITNPTVNNLCTSAISATLCQTLGDLTYATTVPSFTVNCASAATTYPDLWYTFTTATTGSVNVIVTPSSTLNTSYQLLSGSCSSLTNVNCYNPANSLGGVDNTSVNLTAGTYYLRITPSATTIPSNPTFTLTLNTPMSFTPNNDVTLNTFPSTTNISTFSITPSTSCSPISGTLAGASRTFAGTTSGCSTTGVPDNDVWYYFTVSTAGTYNINLGVSSTMNGIFEISGPGTTYSGSAGDCVNNGGIGVNESRSYSLGVGTYFLRIYDVRAITTIPCTYDPTFNICITQAPANDGCGNAISLTPNASSCTYTVGTLGGATADGYSACTGVPDNDVWYSFVATSSSHIITVAPSSGMDVAFQVYNIGCGSGSISCTDASSVGVTESGYLTSLAIGGTYWVRIYDKRTTVLFGTPVPSTTSFSVCITTPPVNDECAGSINLVSNTTGNTTAGTTITLATQSLPTCVSFTNSATANDVWYSFTAVNASEIVTVAGASGYDAAFDIYTGSCGSLSTVSGSCTNSVGVNGTETYTLSATIGQIYTVRVFGMNGSTGTFTINVRHPLNDLCSQATTLNCGDVLTGTTSGATNTGDPTGTCSSITNSNAGVWYTFTGPSVTSSVVISLCGSATSHNVRIYTGSCGSTTCVTTTNSTASCTNGNTQTFLATAGVTYYAFVAPSGSQGGFSISMTCTPQTVTYDICQGAISVSCGSSYNGSTIGATTTGNPATCGTAVTTAGVWYVLAGNGNAVVADLCTGLSYDNKLSVYSGSCGALACIAGNDDVCGLGATVTFNTTIGINYYIFVHGFGGATGNFTLTLTCVTPPVNDLCLNASLVPCNSTSISGTTILATTSTDYDNPHPWSCFNQGTSFGQSSSTGPGVWYLLQDTVASSTSVTITQCPWSSGQFDGQLRLWSVPVNGDCTNLSMVCVAGNDDLCGFGSQITFTAQPGNQYFLMVSRFGTNTGNFNLSISGYSNCATPLPIELVYFDGYAQGSKNRLVWKTASEINSNYFEIEKSLDANNFTTIGRVQAAGNSISLKDYSFDEHNPYQGVTYYRLKQIDYNGQYEYSGIIAIDRNSPLITMSKVRPNPTNNDANVDFYTHTKSNIRMQLFDFSGRQISEQSITAEAGMNSLTVPTKDLPAGLYTVRIISDLNGWSEAVKVIKN
jgi:Secretion system C-terminal sorting domain